MQVAAVSRLRTVFAYATRAYDPRQNAWTKMAARLVHSHAYSLSSVGDGLAHIAVHADVSRQASITTTTQHRAPSPPAGPSQTQHLYDGIAARGAEREGAGRLQAACKRRGART